MRTRRDIQTRNLAAEYRTRFAVLAAASSPEQKNRLRQEQRKAEAAIVKAHQPENFGVWRRQKTALLSVASVNLRLSLPNTSHALVDHRPPEK
jgi:hypothetical protein